MATSSKPRKTSSTEATRKRTRASSLLNPDDHIFVKREPNRTNPRIAIYLRISAISGDSNSIARQTRELAMRIDNIPGSVHDPAVDVYTDEGISGSGAKHRPGLEALLANLHLYDGVAAYELARLGRNPRELRRITDLFISNGVELYLVRESGFSLYNAVGGVLLEIIAGQAEAELEAIRERTASVHAFRAPYGTWRTNRVPFGMEKHEVASTIPNRTAPLQLLRPNRTLVVEDATGKTPADIVQEMAAKVIAGTSCAKVAQDLNDRGVRTYLDYDKDGNVTGEGNGWQANNVKRLLQNVHLIGQSVKGTKVIKTVDGRPVVSYDRDVIRDEHGVPRIIHTPLLSAETWTELQGALASRKQRPRTKRDVLLRGLVRCSECGHVMVGTGSDAHNNVQYQCMTAYQKGKQFCSGNAIKRAWLDEYVTAAVLELLDDPARLAEVRKSNPVEPDGPSPEELEKAVAEVHAQAARLITLYQQGLIELADVKARKAELDKELDRLVPKRQPKRRTLLDQVQAQDVRTAWDTMEPTERATLMGEIVEQVTVSKSKARGTFDTSRVEIDWRTEG